jgi:hypothetical protein
LGFRGNEIVGPYSERLCHDPVERPNRSSHEEIEEQITPLPEQTIDKRENSKNDPVNVLNSDFGPQRLGIYKNSPPTCVFLG